jgi:hypothetical protein
MSAFFAVIQWKVEEAIHIRGGTYCKIAAMTMGIHAMTFRKCLLINKNTIMDVEINNIILNHIKFKYKSGNKDKAGRTHKIFESHIGHFSLLYFFEIK